MLHRPLLIVIALTLTVVAITVACAVQAAAPATELDRGFLQPPDSARPWVYWFWLNGNITRQGITADLEAMKRVGIGGVLIMEVDQGTPKGPAPFGKPEWRELFKFVCAEAHRLGLEVNMNNDAGWCGSGGPWIPPELSMQKVVWSETRAEGGRQFECTLPQPAAVAGYYRDIAVLAVPEPAGPPSPIKDILGKASFTPQHFGPQPATFATLPADQTIPRDKIVDLTAKMEPSGRVLWDAPPGKWLVLRFGHTSTGKDNHPAPEAGRGLECDKFSKEAADAQFHGLMQRLIEDSKPLAGEGRTLVSTHIDSWEVGSQNWTPRMREEFQKRRGYDILPFLPVYTGRVVDSLEVSERFLWDLRQTVSDLIVENYAGRFRELAHRHGLRLSIEAYDGNPCDDMTYAGQADEPMGEFWSWHEIPFRGDTWCTEMSSAAHIYGRKILGAEAFTATDTERWLSHPGNIKAQGDWAFCEGINRFVFHRYAMQPWRDVRPGMSMGPWGLHYERTQTWWEQSKAWHTYLARCQYLLQQGLFVADVCYLQPEGAPRSFQAPKGAMAGPHERSGYNFDGCTTEVVMTRMSVKDGRIVLPDGMSYRVLVLPEAETMTPALLGKIKELIEAGATVVAPSRPLKSPSLTNYPQCDAEVKQLVAELWDGGKVIVGSTAAQVFAEQKIPADFAPAGKLRYSHRRLPNADVYFVANGTDQTIDGCCSFRIVGVQPELWNPETGRIAPLITCGDQKDGVTRVPQHLEPSESAFIVFRDGVSADPAERLISLTTADRPPTVDWARREISQPGKYEIRTADGRSREVDASTLPAPREIVGPWQLEFPPDSGAPRQITLEKLTSWSTHSEAGVRYFSGTATYHNTFNLAPDMLGPGRRLYLDLGRVQVMAEVKLNGKDLGVLWKSPFRVDITEAAIAGKNELELKVVNLWINRMIGDEQLAEDSDRKPDGTLKAWPQWLEEGKPSPTGRHTCTTWRLWKKDSPLVESGLLGPVTIHAAATWDGEK